MKIEKLLTEAVNIKLNAKMQFLGSSEHRSRMHIAFEYILFGLQ